MAESQWKHGHKVGQLRRRHNARVKDPKVSAIRGDLIIEMYAKCMTQHEIATALGMDQGSVSRMLATELERRAADAPELTARARGILNERLEIMLRSWFPLAVGSETDPPNEKAAEITLKILDRQARINGVEINPTVINNNVFATPEDLRREVMASLDGAAVRRQVVAATLERQDDPSIQA